MTQTLLILGATSGIGALCVKNALSRGLQVRGFARSAEKMPAQDGLEAFAGDARKAEDVTRALDGVDGVIYALGVKERLSMLWEKESLFSETTATLIDAMRVAGVARLVAVTGFGAGRSRSAMSSLEKAGHWAILGRPYADKDRQEELIVDSGLDWTIARPVILTKGTSDKPVQVLRDPKDWRNGLVPRAGVARYLVDAVVDGLDVKGDVVLVR